MRDQLNVEFILDVDIVGPRHALRRLVKAFNSSTDSLTPISEQMLSRTSLKVILQASAEECVCYRLPALSGKRVGEVVEAWEYVSVSQGLAWPGLARPGQAYSFEVGQSHVMKLIERALSYAIGLTDQHCLEQSEFGPLPPKKTG